jgi:ATP-dependent helicase HrpB
MRTVEPDSGWPDLTGATLKATIQDWLTPWLAGVTRLSDVGKLDLHAILRGLMPRDLASRLDRDLPTHLTLPAGRAAIDYTEAPPLASAKAQAFYGMATTPRLAGGRVPLRLALLSPAGRPVAVTADLAGFWKGAWADARRDMRGRYPRHRWPEDGANPPEN